MFTPIEYYKLEKAFRKTRKRIPSVTRAQVYDIYSQTKKKKVPSNNNRPTAVSNLASVKEAPQLPPLVFTKF